MKIDERSVENVPTEGSNGEPVGAYETTDAINFMRSFTRHVAFVRLALTMVGQELEKRGLRHDMSKLLDDEFAGFSRINKAARVNKFGSPEYAEGMKRERSVIDLHFSRNGHHPERPDLLAKKGGSLLGAHPYLSPDLLTFLDVIEMVCDWWGARAGYDDLRSWADTVELNFKNKGHLLTPEQRWLARSVADFLASPQPKSGS